MDEAQYKLRYRVELDARTGEITQIKEFVFRGRDLNDLEYLLNWQ